MASPYRNPIQRWPERNGYRAVERMADVALMPADEVPDTPVQWLWPGTIPLGHVTLVAGESGCGKSFWMADVAARVSCAWPWPDGSDHTVSDTSSVLVSRNGSVVFVNSDDSFEDVQQARLAAAQAQLPLVGLMRRMPPGSRFSAFNSVGPVDLRLQALKAAIQEAGDCKLAVVDDLTRYVRDGLGKVTRGDLMLAIDSLKCIAAECNVAILVVWRLDRTGRSAARHLEALLPSAAMAWLVGNDPYRAGQRWAVPLKNHFGPLSEPMAFHIADNRVVWDEPPGTAPADVMAAFVRKSDRRSEREQAGRWALERLADGPVEANELFDDAEAFGFCRRTVRRALVDLGLKPKKLGNDGPWCWTVDRLLRKRNGDEESYDVPTASERPTACDPVSAETSEVDRPSVLDAPSACGASGLRGASDTHIEDGQLAQEDEVENPRDADAESTTTVLTPALSQRESENAGEIQNRKSKIENTEVEDGQLAPEDDDADFNETYVGVSEDDKYVIVVVHPNVPGAQVTVEEGQVGSTGAPQTSGP